MNDHADRAVSEVTSGAGDADDTVRGPGGLIDEGWETDQAAAAPDRPVDAPDRPVDAPDRPVDAPDHPVDTAKNAEAVAGHSERSVDDAVSRLDELDSTDVSEHPAIYEDIHRSLAEALDDTPASRADQ